jgi:hypothetical protein
MSTVRMATLSIRQPWAWLIVNGHKDIENRDWHTPFRGRVLIHAGKTFPRVYYEAVSDDLMHLFGADAPALPPYEDLQLGGVVGVATIVDCVKKHDSRWFFGQYGFLMKDARPLPHLPALGKLGFFDLEVPADLLDTQAASA